MNCTRPAPPAPDPPPSVPPDPPPGPLDTPLPPEPPPPHISILIKFGQTGLVQVAPVPVLNVSLTGLRASKLPLISTVNDEVTGTITVPDVVSVDGLPFELK